MSEKIYNLYIHIVPRIEFFGHSVIDACVSLLPARARAQKRR